MIAKQLTKITAFSFLALSILVAGCDSGKLPKKKDAASAEKAEKKKPGKISSNANPNTGDSSTPPVIYKDQGDSIETSKTVKSTSQTLARSKDGTPSILRVAVTENSEKPDTHQITIEFDPGVLPASQDDNAKDTATDQPAPAWTYHVVTSTKPTLAKLADGKTIKSGNVQDFGGTKRAFNWKRKQGELSLLSSVNYSFELPSKRPPTFVYLIAERSDENDTKESTTKENTIVGFGAGHPLTASSDNAVNTDNDHATTQAAAKDMATLDEWMQGQLTVSKAQQKAMKERTANELFVDVHANHGFILEREHEPKPTDGFEPMEDWANCPEKRNQSVESLTKNHSCEQIPTQFTRDPKTGELLVVRWGKLPVTFHLRIENLGTPMLREHVEAVFSELNEKSRFPDGLVELAQETTLEPAKNFTTHTIDFVLEDPSTAKDSKKDASVRLGATAVSKTEQGEIRDADIELYWGPIRDYISKWPGQIDRQELTDQVIRYVVMHEVLHALGLTHNSADEAQTHYHSKQFPTIPSPTLGLASLDYRLNSEPGKDFDLQALWYLYDENFRLPAEPFVAKRFPEDQEPPITKP